MTNRTFLPFHHVFAARQDTSLLCPCCRLGHPFLLINPPGYKNADLHLPTIFAARAKGKFEAANPAMWGRVDVLSCVWCAYQDAEPELDAAAAHETASAWYRLVTAPKSELPFPSTNPDLIRDIEAIPNALVAAMIRCASKVGQLFHQLRFDELASRSDPGDAGPFAAKARRERGLVTESLFQDYLKHSDELLRPVGLQDHAPPVTGALQRQGTGAVLPWAMLAYGSHVMWALPGAAAPAENGWDRYLVLHFLQTLADRWVAPKET